MAVLLPLAIGTVLGDRLAVLVACLAAMALLAAMVAITVVAVVPP